MASDPPGSGGLDERPSHLRSAERGRGPPRGGFRFAGSAGFARLRLRFEAALEREIDAGRGFLWLPVAFASGILLYFSLPSEPFAPALAALTLILAAAAWRVRHGRVGVFRLLLVAATVAAGATTIKFRTDAVAAPRLERQSTGTLTGFVEARDARRGGFRLTIRVSAYDAKGISALPRRVTVTVRGAAPAVGEGVRLLARLRPSSGPAMPGGYDFGLPAYYDGIGATGFAYGHTSPTDLGAPPLSIRLKMPLEALREAIRARIAAALSGDTGRVATALVIGDAGGISEEGEDALRQSGLAHVLSVSGLHMVLVAGVVFWSVRAGLALFPGIALRRPIKKWAAIAALLVTFFYLLISGLDVAAQRSFIMTGVLFLAVLLDRRAISVRNVAVATLIVLALSPESLLAAGFQMSFAATLALIAGFEALSRRPRAIRPIGGSRLGSVLRWLGALIGGLALTSLLGGLGTTPFALYHFQRMAPLSILANVAAMPLADFLVMPLALLAVLAMPFGLEAPLLWLMGLGIDGMMAVARTVSAWSAGAGDAAMPSAAALLIFVAGFLWLALMRERWRLAGLAPMLLGGVLALFPPRPDILVAPDGRQVAIRSAEGGYHLLARKADAFITGIWLRTDGDRRDAKDPSLLAGTACDAAGCVAALPDGRLVALALERDAFADDCRMADLIVTPLVAPEACSARVATIDRARLEASGAIALAIRPPDSGAPGSKTPASKTLGAQTQGSDTRGERDPPATTPPEAGASGPDRAQTGSAGELVVGDALHTAADEDVPPGSDLPEARAGPSPLVAAFRVTTAFPPVRRPWMPAYEEDDDAPAVAAQ